MGRLRAPHSRWRMNMKMIHYGIMGLCYITAIFSIGVAVYAFSRDDVGFGLLIKFIWVANIFPGEMNRKQAKLGEKL